MPQDILRLYGEQVIPLSKVVKEFCLKQGNLKETAVFQQLVYGRQIWKELYRKTMWLNRTAVICLNKENTFRLPEDCERLLNVSVRDCNGHIQPLTCDPSLNTINIICCKPKCSCDRCHGEDTLCAAVDSVTYTTEMVTIQDVEYTMETWIRYDNGAIQQQQKVPVLNASTNEVEYTTNITTICNVETTEKGCIKATTTNMDLLRRHCGCGNFAPENCGVFFDWRRINTRLIPQIYNYYGYWNVNAEDRNIVHVFRHDTTHHWHHDPNKIQKVIVSYQTNGEIPGEEILVPEYAQFAIDMGIIWLQRLYNNRASATDKETSKNEWRAAKRGVNQHLNPIRMEIISKMQTNKPLW